ncbi:MAG: hypothetical protein ACYTEP_03905 [Planctomycetota bacterium]
MNPRILRLILLLALLTAVVTVPWWPTGGGGNSAHGDGEGFSAGVFPQANGVDDGISDSGTPTVQDLAREEISARDARSATPRSTPTETADGKSRILIRLEDFGEDYRERLAARAVETKTGMVTHADDRNDLLWLELDPGTYRLTVKIGNAVSKMRRVQAHELQLTTRQQDFEERLVRVLPGKVTEVVYRPNRSGAIFGVVRRGLMPVEGIKVQLLAEEPLIVATDAAGQYRFDGVVAGRQVLKLGRPWIGAPTAVDVKAGEDQEVDLDVPDSGFQIKVQHEELDMPLGNCKVQVRFRPRGAETGLPPLLLPTGPDGKTPIQITGPGEIQFTVYGPQNWGLASAYGTFHVEDSGTRTHEIGLRGGTEVLVRREEGQSGRMTIAMFLTEDGVELGCGGIERLDDDSGYRVWGVPREPGRLFLTRTRSRTMWIADVPASYDHQEVDAEQVQLVPMQVRSVTYADGSSADGVTCLSAMDAEGKPFPIGAVYPRSFGLRSAADKKTMIRPAEIASLPPGRYVLAFSGRDGGVEEVELMVPAQEEPLVLDLRFGE